MVDTALLERQMRNERRRIFLQDAKRIFDLIQLAYGKCTLKDLEKYMVEARLCYSGVEFLESYKDCKDCFTMDDENPGIRLFDVMPDEFKGVSINA